MSQIPTMSVTLQRNDLPPSFEQAFQAASYTADPTSHARPRGDDGLELSDEMIANLDYGYHAFHHNSYVDAVEQGLALNEARMAGTSVEEMPTDMIAGYYGLHEHNGDLDAAADQLMSGLLASYGITDAQAKEYGYEGLTPESVPGLSHVPAERPTAEGLRDEAESIDMAQAVTDLDSPVNDTEDGGSEPDAGNKPSDSGSDQ
ncbi:MAG: hypothetical protein AMXMBFR33_52980 [Candidatus Xenobia bacterium]